MTLGEWLKAAEGRLRAAAVDSAKLDAQVLAAHALGKDRSWVLSNPDAPAPSADELLDRRTNREPLAYILGYREFFGRRFAVDKTVLIPRQETEALVEAALENSPQNARALDIGTGSGCIAVTLKLERPDLRVTATDISVAALNKATENAGLLGAEVDFVQSDLFTGLGGEVFDVIATNPPYIGRDEPLMAEVALHEPEEALYAGESGDEIYRRLSEQAAQYLTVSGVFLCELGYAQGSRISELFRRNGWKDVQLTKDLAGVDRVLIART